MVKKPEPKMNKEEEDTYFIMPRLSLWKRVENNLNLASTYIRFMLGRPLIDDAFTVVKWYAIVKFVLYY